LCRKAASNYQEELTCRGEEGSARKISFRPVKKKLENGKIRPLPPRGFPPSEKWNHRGAQEFTLISLHRKKTTERRGGDPYVRPRKFGRKWGKGEKVRKFKESTLQRGGGGSIAKSLGVH